MVQPTPRAVHTDAILTNILVAFLQSPSAFISRRIFPEVPVQKQTDKYYIFDRNDFFRDQMERRPPATESAGSGYTVSSDSYSCDVWALHKDVPDQVRFNTDKPLDPDRNATTFLGQQALIRMERQWASDYFGTGIWGTDITGVASGPTAGQTVQWSDQLNSDPMADIRLGIRTILASTGYKPNRLVLGYDAFIALQDHPDIVDRVKYTSADTITVDTLARLFRVDEVLVGEAVYASNLEGETAAYSFIQGKHALLCYTAPAPAIDAPSAGYTFVWQGVSNGLGENASIDRFRMDELKADRVEIEMAWDNKRVSQPLGYFFSGIAA